MAFLAGPLLRVMVKKVLPKVEGAAETALSHTKIGSMVLGEVHSLLADADPTSFLLLKNKAECFVYAKAFRELSVLFSRLNALITIPLLIITSATGLLSALASGASAGSSLQKGISPVVAALGCTAAVIHSIEKTLGLSARAQKAQGLSTSFFRLSTKIEAQLTDQHMNSASTTTPEDSARFLKTIGEDIGALLGDVTDMPKNIDALIAAALTSAASGAIASLEGMLGHKQQAAASRGCLSCLHPPPPPPPPPLRQSGSKSSSSLQPKEMTNNLAAPKPEMPPPAFKIVTPLGGGGRDVEAASPAPSPPPQAPYSGPSFFGVRL